MQGNSAATWLVAAAAIATFTGCTPVGPDYRRAPGAMIEAVSANGAFRGGNDRAFAAAPVPDRWWRLYEDPALDQLVQDALAANTDLRVAAANLAKTRAGLAFADAGRNPVTSIGFAPGYSRRSAEEELKGDTPLANNWTYGLTAGISYQVDLFGQISRSIEAAGEDLFAAQAAYESVQVTVVAETTRAYVEACAAGSEAVVARRQLELQDRSLDLTERLRSNGRAIALDVLRSSAQADQVRASLPLFEARRNVAAFRLATLTGRPPADASILALRCEKRLQLSIPIPIGDGSDLLRRRPDVRRAESELRSATARIGVAVADLYPKVSLGASIGSIGLARDALDTGTLKFSIGPLITWQFPDRSRVKARIQAAEADEAIAYARFDSVVLTALRETESALVVYARDLDAREFLDAARLKSARAADDVDRMFAAGRQNYLAVLEANRSRTAAEQAVAATDTRLAGEQVALFLALGGGWQSEQAKPAKPAK